MCQFTSLLTEYFDFSPINGSAVKEKNILKGFIDNKLTDSIAYLGKTLLSVWISCYRTCRLGITYQTSELKIREASFHHIGALSDGKWHKIALHIFPHSHPKKTLAGLYVDCKMRGRRQLLTQIEEFFPSSSKISQDIVFLFGRRSGKTDSAMLTWKVWTIMVQCMIKRVQI